MHPTSSQPQKMIQPSSVSVSVRSSPTHTPSAGTTPHTTHGAARLTDIVRSSTTQSTHGISTSNHPTGNSTSSSVPTVRLIAAHPKPELQLTHNPEMLPLPQAELEQESNPEQSVQQLPSQVHLHQKPQDIPTIVHIHKSFIDPKWQEHLASSQQGTSTDDPLEQQRTSRGGTLEQLGPSRSDPFEHKLALGQEGPSRGDLLEHKLDHVGNTMLEHRSLLDYGSVLVPGRPLLEQVTLLQENVTPLTQQLTPLDQQVMSLPQHVTALSQQVTSLPQQVTSLPQQDVTSLSEHVGSVSDQTTAWGQETTWNNAGSQ